MDKVLHANDDNMTLSGAFIIAWRVEKYLRKYGFTYDYISMDDFDLRDQADFPIPKGTRTFGAKLRDNRFIGMIKLPFYVRSVVKKHKYKIIHIDADYTYKALFYAIPAKHAGLKTVVHSHTTSLAGDHQKLKYICHKIAKSILSHYTDAYIGCSKEAAQWMIPVKRQNKKMVLFNGIDLQKFVFDESERELIRKELSLEDKFVIGNVGSICERKNQLFLVDVLKKVKEKKPSAVLLLVGSGIDEYIQRVKRRANELGVGDSVILYGLTPNTVPLFNAMDVFAFPSFVEGAPLAVYEAQATGLPCIMSNTVSHDACITSWITEAPIDQGPDVWRKMLCDIDADSINDRKKRRVDTKYGLEQMAKSLSSIYKRLSKNE